VLSVVHISESIERPYMETILRGEDRVRVSAPVLASYDLTISDGMNKHVFWVEVRFSPCGEQVDWSDELQDFMSERRAIPDSWNELSQLIYAHYSSNEISIPMIINCAQS